MAVSPGGSRLRQVGSDVEVPEAAPAPAPVTRRDQAALGMIVIALKALSERAIVAAGHLAAMAALASVWWLFASAIPADPSVHQLIALGLYGWLVLAVLWVRRGVAR